MLAGGSYLELFQPVPLSDIETFSAETITDAKEHQQFIYLLGPSVRRVNIVQVKRLWIDNPTIILDLNYRLVGTPQDVTAFLIRAQIASNYIEIVFRDAIKSVDNPLYAKELKLFEDYQRSILITNTRDIGATLMDWIVKVNPNAVKNVKSGKEAEN